MVFALDFFTKQLNGGIIMALYRQNSNWGKTGEEEAEEQKVYHGNTRLPFGLCKRYGIAIGDDWTPRDAWNALAGRGITPQKIYDQLKGKGSKDSNTIRTQEGDVIDAETGEVLEFADPIDKMLNDDRVVYSRTLTRDRFEKDIKSGTKEMQDTTVSLFNADSFGYNADERSTAFYPGFNKVCVKSDEMKDCYVEGEVFYHETWHAIDYNYGQFENSSQDFASLSWGKSLSYHYVLSTGITLHQTVVQEGKNINWEAVKADIAAEVDAYYANLGLDRKSVIQKYNEMKAKASETYIRVYNETGDFLTAEREERKIYDTEEFLKAEGEYNEVIRVPTSIKTKYSNLSDIYCGVTRGNDRLVGMGHAKSYWSSNKYARGIEAFAEVASAKATNLENYNVLKKYCPKTVAAFEEIYSKLVSGEIKPKGRKKI